MGRPDLQTGSNNFTMLSLPLSHTGTKLHTCTRSHTCTLPHEHKPVGTHVPSVTHREPLARVPTHRRFHTVTFPHFSALAVALLTCTRAHIHTHPDDSQTIICQHSTVTAKGRSDLSMLSGLELLLERNSSVCSIPRVFESSEYSPVNLHS